jgi:hypothetical protein
VAEHRIIYVQRTNPILAMFGENPTFLAITCSCGWDGGLAIFEGHKPTERAWRRHVKAAVPTVMMHVADAGIGHIRFSCSRCGHDTGWIEDRRTVSENRKGSPCPKCNRLEAKHTSTQSDAQAQGEK